MTTTINASPTNGLVYTADGSGVLKVQSNGKTTNALAWVNFNGTGTPAIRDSYNVTSITLNGTGDYTVNFTSAMADANYAGIATSGFGSGSRTALRATNISDQFTGSFRFNVASSNGANDSVLWNNVVIFGN